MLDEALSTGPGPAVGKIHLHALYPGPSLAPLSLPLDTARSSQRGCTQLYGVGTREEFGAHTPGVLHSLNPAPASQEQMNPVSGKSMVKGTTQLCRCLVGA